MIMKLPAPSLAFITLSHPLRVFAVESTRAQVLCGNSKGTIGDMSINVRNSLTGIEDLVEGVASVAALCLAITALFKFKAPRDNPQQVPLVFPKSNNI
jgi:hypothetical protein